ncbi:hypothetical protein [Neisseria sp. S1]|uniref:hypothetical protein n=1 Tax=Neisseria sp. S1 TaxID=3318354 RepID=UPI003A8C1E44
MNAALINVEGFAFIRAVVGWLLLAAISRQTCRQGSFFHAYPHILALFSTLVCISLIRNPPVSEIGLFGVFLLCAAALVAGFVLSLLRK